MQTDKQTDKNMMTKIFHLTFALAAAALLSSPVTVSASASGNDNDDSYQQGSGMSNDSYRQGFDDGEREAMQIWKYKYGGRCCCKSYSKFKKEVYTYIHNYYWWYASDNKKKKSSDNGAQAGMKNVLQKYQYKCHCGDHWNDDWESSSRGTDDWESSHWGGGGNGNVRGGGKGNGGNGGNISWS